MTITVDEVKKVLDDRFTRFDLAEDFKTEENIQWLTSAASLKQVKGLALAASDLLKAGILNEVTRAQLYRYPDHAKRIHNVIKWLDPKLLSGEHIDNFYSLFNHLVHLKNIGRCVLEVSHGLGRDKFPQQIFLQILKYAPYTEGLGECFSALTDANMLNEQRILSLFSNAEYAHKLGEGLDTLETNNILTKLHFDVLISKPEKADTLSSLFEVLHDAGMFDEADITHKPKITFLLNNLQYSDVMLFSFRALHGLRLLNIESFRLVTSDIQNILPLTFRLVISSLSLFTQAPTAARTTSGTLERSTNEQIIITAKKLGIEVPKVPDDFICPFSCEIMDKPAKNSNPASISPHRGDLKNMVKISKLFGSDPWTRGSMSLAHIHEDLILKAQIQRFISPILQQIRARPGHQNSFPGYLITKQANDSRSSTKEKTAEKLGIRSHVTPVALQSSQIQYKKNNFSHYINVGVGITVGAVLLGLLGFFAGGPLGAIFGITFGILGGGLIAPTLSKTFVRRIIRTQIEINPLSYQVSSSNSCIYIVPQSPKDENTHLQQKPTDAPSSQTPPRFGMY